MDYEKLYETCYMQVYSYAMTLCRNPHMAEEITQETFYRVLLAGKKNPFRGESDELTWLCAIAKNLFADEMLLFRFGPKNKRIRAGLVVLLAGIAGFFAKNCFRMLAGGSFRLPLLRLNDWVGSAVDDNLAWLLLFAGALVGSALILNGMLMNKNGKKGKISK